MYSERELRAALFGFLPFDLKLAQPNILKKVIGKMKQTFNKCKISTGIVHLYVGAAFVLHLDTIDFTCLILCTWYS